MSWAEIPKVFQTIVGPFLGKQEVGSIMREAQKNYDIRPYKISKLSEKEVLGNYRELQNKYESEELVVCEDQWHENQRRVFLWFAILLSNSSGKRLQDLQFQVWTSLSEVFFNKNPAFLQFQCRLIVKTHHRVRWNEREDQLLIQAIQLLGLGKWSEISKKIFFITDREVFRTPKQCRQRWLNHLDQSKVKKSWTPKEDEIIMESVRGYGTSWARLIPFFKFTRTEHTIKNRYYALVRRQKKLRTKAGGLKDQSSHPQSKMQNFEQKDEIVKEDKIQTVKQEQKLAKPSSILVHTDNQPTDHSLGSLQYPSFPSCVFNQLPYPFVMSNGFPDSFQFFWNDSSLSHLSNISSVLSSFCFPNQEQAYGLQNSTNYN